VPVQEGSSTSIYHVRVGTAVVRPRQSWTLDPFLPGSGPDLGDGFAAGETSESVMLTWDVPLATKFRDHPFSGPSEDFRDCHIRPDLVPIYQKRSDSILQLVRLGSHSELGL
jgi:addiction module RelE/StbE family toxin